MQEHLYALIMAGGGGTRLWPLSRRAHPKQTLTLFGERSMFQLSLDRLRGLLPMEHILVVTAAEQVEPLAAQAPELPRENFIVEPEGRGTASCIGLGALHLHRRDPEAVMMVLTADHFIRKVEVFQQVLLAAATVAQRGYLVTLGIEPTYPATGYGYINRGAPLEPAGDFNVYRVARFTEKPDPPTAETFVAAGSYYWNSGMFIWQTARILEEIERLMPELGETLTALEAALSVGTYPQVVAEQWPQVRKETIDYGIMERAEQVAVIPVELGWSDVGGWAAVMALHTDEADAEGNIHVGPGAQLPIDSQGTLVFAQTPRLVATIGLEDIVVVDTPDALLITTREQAQRVREVVEHLRAQDEERYL